MPTASPINTEPVCKISVLVLPAESTTEFVAPLNRARVRHRAGAQNLDTNASTANRPAGGIRHDDRGRQIVKVPKPPPEMVPPLKSFTVRVVDAWMPAPFTLVASILPVLPVTVTFLPEMALPRQYWSPEWTCYCCRW